MVLPRIPSAVARFGRIACLFLAVLAGLLAPSGAAAQTRAPDYLEIKSTDRVFWKGRAGDTFLIINVFASQPRLSVLQSTQQNDLLIKTALREGALQLERPEASTLTSLNVLFVSMKDMSEYGGSNNNWTQVGTATLVRTGSKVELTDIKLAGTLPSPLPTAAFPYKEASATMTAASIRFRMPRKLYLVVGEPQTFFYENLVVSRDIEDFVYTPSGNSIAMATYGRRGLTFTAQAAHVGEHDLLVKVADWDGKTIAEGATKVVVTPATMRWQPSASEPVRILMVGHSLPSMYYPAYIADHLAAPGNPEVAFVGGIKYWYGKLADFRNNPNTDAMFHQASPGYSVSTVLNLYTEEPPANPNMPAKSPFIFKNADGKPVFDIKRYASEVLKGKAPHFVLLNIGDNDTFGYDPNAPDPAQEKLFKDNMNRFLDELRSIAPDAVFGAIMPNTYNYSDRSFLHNYGPNFPRLKQMQNRQRYIELMTEIADTRTDLQIVPSNFSVDSVDGMPYNSGTHFNTLGARQFASSIYAWLKAQMAIKGGVAGPETRAAVPVPVATVAQTTAPAPAASVPLTMLPPEKAPVTLAASSQSASQQQRPDWLQRQYTRILRALSFE